MRRIIFLFILASCLSLSAHAASYAQCGYPIVGASNATGQNFEAATTKCVAPFDAVVVDCGMYIVTAGTGQIGCALLDSDNGTSGGDPGTVLCQGTSAGSPTGSAWNIISLVSCPHLTGGHIYWIARNYAGSSTTQAYDVYGSTKPYFAQTCCTFINFTTGYSHTASLATSMYLDIAEISTTQCGVTTTTGLPGGGSGNSIGAISQCSPLGNSTVIDCQVYINSGLADTFGCAIYADNGSGVPTGAAICSATGSTGTSSGFVTLPLSGCGTLLAATRYWLAINVGSLSSNRFYNVASGTEGTAANFSFSSTCSGISCTFGTFSGSPTPGVGAQSAFLDIVGGSATQIGAYIVGP